MDLEHYLEDHLVTASSMRVRITKCNDYPGARLCHIKKKERDGKFMEQ